MSVCVDGLWRVFHLPAVEYERQQVDHIDSKWTERFDSSLIALTASGQRQSTGPRRRIRVYFAGALRLLVHHLPAVFVGAFVRYAFVLEIAFERV